MTPSPLRRRGTTTPSRWMRRVRITQRKLCPQRGKVGGLPPNPVAGVTTVFRTQWFVIRRSLRLLRPASPDVPSSRWPYLELYKSITHCGGSGSSLKSRFNPRLLLQRHSHVGPRSLTTVSLV